MAAVQGIHVSCMPHASFPQKFKEKTCSCSYAPRHHLSRTSGHSKVFLRSSHRPKHGCLLFCSRTRNRTRSFQSVSYQDVAENESDGNDATSPSTAPTLDRDKVWQHLQGSLQHWGQNLSDRGSLHIAKQFMAITETRINNGEAKQNLAHKLQRMKAPDVSKLWSGTDPSVKWPAVIFIPLYVIVRASCGVAVCRELWPLWTIWPLATSFYIRAGIYVSRFCQERALVLGKPLVTYLKSGRLPQDLRNGVAVVPNYVRDKRAACTHYLRTKAGSDLKAALFSFCLWLLEKYEDLVDWLWPSWRIFWRGLMNLF